MWNLEFVQTSGEQPFVLYQYSVSGLAARFGPTRIGDSFLAEVKRALGLGEKFTFTGVFFMLGVNDGGSFFPKKIHDADGKEVDAAPPALPPRGGKQRTSASAKEVFDLISARLKDVTVQLGARFGVWLPSGWSNKHIGPGNASFELEFSPGKTANEHNSLVSFMKMKLLFQKT